MICNIVILVSDEDAACAPGTYAFLYTTDDFQFKYQFVNSLRTLLKLSFKATVCEAEREFLDVVLKAVELNQYLSGNERKPSVVMEIIEKKS